MINLWFEKFFYNFFTVVYRSGASVVTVRLTVELLYYLR